MKCNYKILLMSVIVLFINSYANAQWKSFKISDRGDTINRIDKKDLKQGKWVERFPAVRVTPGYDEEGIYKDGRKEGIWRTYTLQGDLVSVENYKWGLLSGKSSYYNMAGLEREESWLALNPDKQYDTIIVADLYEDGKYKSVRVKNEGHSLRHGKWTYYDATRGFITNTENYVWDTLDNPLKVFGIASKRKAAPVDSSGNKKMPPKTDEILKFEKLSNKKKKKILRDGETGYTPIP